MTRKLSDDQDCHMSMDKPIDPGFHEETRSDKASTEVFFLFVPSLTGVSETQSDDNVQLMIKPPVTVGKRVDRVGLNQLRKCNCTRLGADLEG